MCTCVTGVEHVDVCAVDDNILARLVDPVFLGYCHTSGLDAAAKVVEPAAVAAAYGSVLGTPGDATAESTDLGEDLSEDISFLVPAIGSYYFSMNALNDLCNLYTQRPLTGYRLVPSSTILARGAAAAMPALPPNMPAAARAQAMAAAAQAAASAAPKRVQGYTLQRLLSDVFVSPVLQGGNVGLWGVEASEEFSLLWGAGPHYTLPDASQAVGDLMYLHTRYEHHHYLLLLLIAIQFLDACTTCVRCADVMYVAA